MISDFLNSQHHSIHVKSVVVVRFAPFQGSIDMMKKNGGEVGYWMVDVSLKMKTAEMDGIML